MTAAEILAAGGLLAVLLTLVEITPLKLNPWSALARALGRALNREVLQALQTLQQQAAETQAQLQEHIARSGEEQADAARQAILKFHSALLRGERHSEEEFAEVLALIDRYEAYCRAHPDYPNSRAVAAVAGIRAGYQGLASQ